MKIFGPPFHSINKYLCASMLVGVLFTPIAALVWVCTAGCVNLFAAIDAFIDCMVSKDVRRTIYGK